jgi:hypothetical protein
VLLQLALTAVLVGPVIWGLVDAIRRPGSAFKDAGRTKGVWIGILVVALVAPPIVGVGLAIWYLVAVRPKVAVAQAATADVPPADER